MDEETLNYLKSFLEKLFSYDRKYSSTLLYYDYKDDKIKSIYLPARPYKWLCFKCGKLIELDEKEDHVSGHKDN